MSAAKGTEHKPRQPGTRSATKAGGPSRHLAPEGVLTTRVLAVVALVVAGVGVATGLVLEDWASKPVRILLGVALFLVVLFFLTNWRWLVHFVITRKALISLNVLVMLVVAAVILVMVNYLSYRHFWRKDYSQSQLYQLSGQTKNIVSSLDQSVSIMVFYDPGTQEGFEASQYLRQLLAEYVLVGPRITTEFIRLDSDPARLRELVKKYEVTEANTVVVTAGEQRKNVPPTEIIKHQGGMYDQPVRTIYAGEPAITAAIKAVTEPEQKKVYFVTGHKERSPALTDKNGYSSAARDLRGANYEVPDPVNLLTVRDVPRDCDLLVIAGPERPFAPEEVEALARYLDQGKPAFILLDPLADADYRFIRFGFESLLEARGISVKDTLVLDPDSAYLYPTNPVPQSVSSYHDITRAMQGVSMVFQYARSLETKRAEGGYTATPLLRTSARSWGETDLQTEDKGQPTGGGANLLEDAGKNWKPGQWVGGQLLLLTEIPGEIAKQEQQTVSVIASTPTTVTVSRKFSQIPDGKKKQQYLLRKPMGPDEGKDDKGPLTLAVAGSRSDGGRAGASPPGQKGPGRQTHRLVVVGDSDWAGNSSIGLPGNQDFFLNCVSWLTGKTEDIGIRPKKPELAGLSLDARQMKAMIWVVLVAMPAAIILAGCVVWWLRRLV